MNFIENESAEKLRGGYYTPAPIADYLARWVAEAQPKRVLEPSCGDGAFLSAIGRARSKTVREIIACELLDSEAARAREIARALPTRIKSLVHGGDFLGWATSKLDTDFSVDAVVGNPPFIRYQYLEASLQRRAQVLFERFGLAFTKHTNAWVPFVVASLALLRPGGRLAMVLPAEILHVLHAESLREFLLRLCSRVLVLDPEELWFEETLQGVVLLLAERKAEHHQAQGKVAVNRIRGESFLADSAEREFKKASFVTGDRLGHKWMLALLSAEERDLLDDLRQRRTIRPFADVAHVAVGIVTGANNFFLVRDDVVDRYGLSEFAHPMFGRSEHVPGVIYDARTHAENRRVGYPTNFLWFKGTAKSSLPSGVRRYIESGEAENLHTRYKCRIRSPWYEVPSVFAAPVGMLKRSHEHPRLVLNTAGAFTTDTAYRIKPTNCMSAEQLVFAHVNSLTALSSEVEGRHYGGGVLELVPTEINRVMVPYLPHVAVDLRRLDEMYRQALPPTAILEAQDSAVLRPLGLLRSQCETLRAAWFRLRSRRHRTTTEEQALLD